MKDCKFKATKIIAEHFTDREIDFEVHSYNGCEGLTVIIPIDDGPYISIDFISCDNSNAVTVRVHGIMTKIPAEKRSCVIEACNTVNAKKRYIKLFVDSENNVIAEYDFPVKCSDERVGHIAFESLVHIARSLDNEYDTLRRALR